MEGNTGSPAKLGFFMPAEWAPHEATWLSWPKNPITFPPGIIRAVEAAYCRMIAALSEGETVRILADSQKEEDRIRGILKAAGVRLSETEFFHIRTSDVWMRDYGPTFLLSRDRRRKAAVRWRFNAWGDKYADLAEDDSAGGKMAALLLSGKRGCERVFEPGIVMEGGSIEPDGKGIVMTTEQCLLNRNRNPGLAKPQIECILKDFLGAREILWLKSGIEGDDTDGHVDDFARFAPGGKVIACRETNQSDANFRALGETLSTLRAYAGPDGKGLDVVELPMPPPLTDPEENRRLPASHANFYAGNACVLMPSFGGKSDSEAAAILRGCFPGRDIICVPCKELVYGYGGIHCITQQEPKATPHS